MSSADKTEKGPALPADVQAKIGEKLKAIYDDVLSQPVPDRFVELLARLDGVPHQGATKTVPGASN